jgi:hypothetical protein
LLENLVCIGGRVVGKMSHALTYKTLSDKYTVVTGRITPAQEEEFRARGGSWSLSHNGWVMPPGYDTIQSPTRPAQVGPMPSAAAVLPHVITPAVPGVSYTVMEDGALRLLGNTYKMKDAIKGAGGIWLPLAKRWDFAPGTDVSVLENLGIYRASSSVDTPAARSSEDTKTRLIISKHTYAVKEEIKKAGGRWDPRAKGWRVPLDFDDSIIPQSVSKTHTSPPAPLSSPLSSPPLPSPPACEFCKKVGHTQASCSYECDYCGAKRQHLTGDCPTESRCWKLLKGSKNFECTCDGSTVCWYCRNMCCTDASITDFTETEAFSRCPVHGPRKYDI